MAHEIKLSDLIVLNLESHDLDIIADAINNFGSGDHPVAANLNLDYFDLDYMLDCLDKGSKECSGPEFEDEVIDLWCAIHMAKDEHVTAMKI